MFITSGNWRGKRNSLSRGVGADQPKTSLKMLLSSPSSHSLYVESISDWDLD